MRSILNSTKANLNLIKFPQLFFRHAHHWNTCLRFNTKTLHSINLYRCVDGIGALSGRKEMLLFNDALNTFYLRLYGVRHMVKNHSESNRGHPLPLLIPISSKVSCICIIPQTGFYQECNAEV